MQQKQLHEQTDNDDNDWH